MNTSVTRVTTPAGDPAWRVTGYDAVKELLADPRLGRSHPNPAQAAKFSESVMFGQAAQAESPEVEREQHAMMRQLLSRSFSARRMSQLKPRVQGLVDDLLTEIERQPRPVDLHEALSFPLPAQVICELLGVPYEDREDFRRWSTEAGDTVDADRSRAGWESLQAYMKRLIDRKRDEPAEDVLSDLIAVQTLSAGAMTDDHLVGLAAGLLFAGHETTVAAINRGVVLFLTHPDQLALLKDDPSLVPSAVEEVLRFPDPYERPDVDYSSGLPRFANADIDAGGVTIPAGDMVMLDLTEANLEADQFPGPHTFDITRRPNSHVTFGHGPHFCIGAPLARIELQAVFGTLFERLPGLRLAIPVEELVPNTQRLVSGLDSLPVTW